MLMIASDGISNHLHIVFTYSSGQHVGIQASVTAFIGIVMYQLGACKDLMEC